MKVKNFHTHGLMQPTHGKSEMRVTRDYLFGREFKALPGGEKIATILDNAEVLFDDESPMDQRLSQKQKDYLVTTLLRNECGCELQYYDEVLEDFVSIDEHSPRCHKIRFPIDGDHTDKTLKLRSHREILEPSMAEFEEKNL